MGAKKSGFLGSPHKWIRNAMYGVLILLFAGAFALAAYLRHYYTDQFSLWLSMAFSILGTGGLAVMGGIKIGKLLVAGELEHVQTTLILALTNIDKTLREAASDNITSFSQKIDHCKATLYGCLTGLEKISGIKTSSEDMENIETRQRELRIILAGVGERVALLETNLSFGNASTQTIASLEGIKQDLSRAIVQAIPSSDSSADGAKKAGPERAKVSTTTPCPNCATAVTFDIGINQGDSAFPECTNCHKKFHAHRGANGIFTVLPGKPIKVRVTKSVNCPSSECGRKIAYSAAEQGDEDIERICAYCAEKVSINVGGNMATAIGKVPTVPGFVAPDGALQCEICHHAVDVGPFAVSENCRSGVCLEPQHRVLERPTATAA